MKPRVLNQPSNLSRIPREQLEQQHMALLAQLGEARQRFYGLDAPNINRK